MAVEPWFTGTGLVSSAILPPIFIRLARTNAIVAFLASVVLANVLSEIVFRWMRPDFHYGLLYPLGVIMNVLLTMVIAGFVCAITAIVLNWIEFQK